MTTINVAFDMETSDPDDALTLCFLAGHPKIKLRAVSITPGSKYQVGVVKKILNKLELNIPVGAKNKDHAKQCVSEFHYKWLGNVGPEEPDGNGHTILNDALTQYPDLTIITGGPLGNIKNLITNHNPKLNKIIVQGGFAGDSVVDPKCRLEKFACRETCPTFNLNGDVEAAFTLLAYDGIKEKYFVSKNVCHGVLYDQPLHSYMKYFVNNIGVKILVEAMEIYLKNRPSGKLMHDPLAATTVYDKNICQFKEVELYRSKGEWGSKLANNTNTFISTAVNKNRFMEVLAGKL